MLKEEFVSAEEEMETEEFDEKNKSRAMRRKHEFASRRYTAWVCAAHNFSGLYSLDRVSGRNKNIKNVYKRHDHKRQRQQNKCLANANAE